jgi:prophage DNA circulation protein
MNIAEIFDKAISEVTRITGIKFSDSASAVDKLHALTAIPSFSEQTKELNEKIETQSGEIETQNAQLSAFEAKISSIETALSGLANLKTEIIASLDSKIKSSEEKFSAEVLKLKNTEQEKVVDEIETGSPLKVEKVSGTFKFAGKDFTITKK